MLNEKIITSLNSLKNRDDLDEFIKELRVISANQKSDEILEIIERAIKLCINGKLTRLLDSYYL
jgi:transposase